MTRSTAPIGTLGTTQGDTMTNDSTPFHAQPATAPAAADRPATTPQPQSAGAVAPYAGQVPVAAPGPVGNVRSTGLSMLLYVVTFGIYGLVWYYRTHDEMKRHTGDGIGGGLALVLGLFVGFVMAFLTPGEVGKLYERRGQHAPVSAITGLWILLPLVGAIVWFVKTNGALNAYWRSLGAR
jgi:hypothetical protein